MISSYNALKDFLESKLNSNTNGIDFDVSLFNSQEYNYDKFTDESGSYKVLKTKIVPTNIVEIVGNYINIPNTSVTQNTISLEFDLFLGDYTKLPIHLQNEYKTVDYQNTLLAIENLRKELLAKNHSLGNVGLMFGGTDSSATTTWTTTFIPKTIYLDLELLNNDIESLIVIGTVDDGIRVTKDDTNITATFSVSGIDLATVSTNYSLGMNEIYLYLDVSNNWNLIVNGVSNSVNINLTVPYNQLTISYLNDFNGVLYQLLIDEDAITPEDLENGLENGNIFLKNFDSRYTLNQTGDYVLNTNTVDNCILWGDEGNVIFSFDVLLPISNIRWNVTEEGLPYQMFGLGIDCAISKDIIFGNSTEYFIKESTELDAQYTQIYPIDRSHSYGTELGSAQYIQDKFATTIVEENMKDLAHTFYFTPSKRIQKLFKQTTGKTEEQNKIYNLKVQFPFHSVTYDVIVDSGGTNPNINTLQTITVTYKEADSILT